MTTKIIIAQLIAIMVISVNAIGTVSTKKSNVIFLNGVCNGLSGTQYLLLGAYTGCTSCILAVLRNIIFAWYRKKDKKIPIWTLIVYIVFSLIINIPLYNSWLAILPIINIIVYGYGIWQENIGEEKKATIFVGLTGIIYNFLSMAYVSIISSLIDFIGGAIGLLKYKKEIKEA